MATNNDIAWAAGLFEGEGCIHCRFELDYRDNVSRLRTNLSLEMTDRDIVERFHKIVGCGNIRPDNRKTKGNKLVTSWRAGSREDQKYIINLFYPYFGLRRRGKCDELLAALKKRESQPKRTPIKEETREKISNTVKRFWEENREYMLEKQSHRQYKKDKING